MTAGAPSGSLGAVWCNMGGERTDHCPRRATLCLPAESRACASIVVTALGQVEGPGSGSSPDVDPREVDAR